MYLRIRVKYIVLKELAMSSVSGRNRHPRLGEGRGRSGVESAISIPILSTLFLIRQGIFIKQFQIKTKENLL